MSSAEDVLAQEWCETGFGAKSPTNKRSVAAEAKLGLSVLSSYW